MVQDKNLPLVGVIGCGGNQGLSIVRSLLESGQFRVRGLSPNPQSAKCLNLLQLDFGPHKSLLESDILEFDELRDETWGSLKGLDMLFAMTNPNYLDHEQELRVGKLLADHCKKLGLKHVIWSSLPNVEKISGGQLMVPSFTAKAKVEEYMKHLGLPFTALMPGFFLTNLTQLDIFHFQKMETGEWLLRLPLNPLTKLPLLDAGRDMGPAVLHILLHRVEFLGKTIPLYSEELTMLDIAKMLSPTAKYEMCDGMDLKGKPLEMRNPKLPDMWIDMLMFFDKFGYYRGLPGMANLRKMLKMETEGVEDWLLTSKDLILVG